MNRRVTAWRRGNDLRFVMPGLCPKFARWAKATAANASERSDVVDHLNKSRLAVCDKKAATRNVDTAETAWERRAKQVAVEWVRLQQDSGTRSCEVGRPVTVGLPDSARVGAGNHMNTFRWSCHQTSKVTGGVSHRETIVNQNQCWPTSGQHGNEL